MFWGHKPTKKEPYAESNNGQYRIAITEHGPDEDGNDIFKYTAFVKVGAQGKVDRIWDRLGEVSTDPKDVKRLCVTHSSENRKVKAKAKRNKWTR